MYGLQRVDTMLKKVAFWFYGSCFGVVIHILVCVPAIIGERREPIYVVRNFPFITIGRSGAVTAVMFYVFLHTVCTKHTRNIELLAFACQKCVPFVLVNTRVFLLPTYISPTAPTVRCQKRGCHLRQDQEGSRTSCLRVPRAVGRRGLCPLLLTDGTRVTQTKTVSLFINICIVFRVYIIM